MTPKRRKARHGRGQKAKDCQQVRVRTHFRATRPAGDRLEAFRLEAEVAHRDRGFLQIEVAELTVEVAARDPDQFCVYLEHD